jgi:hypothetical protein
VRMFVNLALLAAVLVRPPHDLSADTLFKKKAAVAIGVGEASKHEVRWANCSRKEPKIYVRPPYSVDKSNNCRLTARDFGLSRSGDLYKVKSMKKMSLFFPDIERGKVAGFQNDSTSGLILLTFGLRSLRLSYVAPPNDDQVISNELSVAEGFVNAGKGQFAEDLLQDANQALQTAPSATFSVPFIVDASVSLFRIKAVSPGLSEVSHSSLLQLAHLRSTLEKEPEGRNPTNQPSCDGISAEDVTIGGEIDRFGSRSSCGFALAPNRDGKLPARVFIGQSLIYGGTQVLDGITWDHDTFVGSRIQYRGGRLNLNKLLFINCTFDVVDNQRGDRLLDLAISHVPHLSIEDQASFVLPLRVR